MAMGEAEYLEQRLDDQLDWYDKKAASNQAAYKRLRLIEIVAAAFIPFLAGYAKDSDYVALAVGAVGVIVAVLASVIGLYRFQENWTEYRAAAEALRQEKFLYLARAEPYDGDAPFEQLVARVEAQLRNETSGWAQSMRASVKGDEEAAEPAADPED